MTAADAARVVELELEVSLLRAALASADCTVVVGAAADGDATTATTVDAQAQAVAVASAERAADEEVLAGRKGELQRQMEGLAGPRAELKAKIKEWLAVFEEREGRPAEKVDKEIVKDLYIALKRNQKQSEAMAAEVAGIDVELEALRATPVHGPASVPTPASAAKALSVSVPTSPVAESPSKSSRTDGAPGSLGVQTPVHAAASGGPGDGAGDEAMEELASLRVQVASLGEELATARAAAADAAADADATSAADAAADADATSTAAAAAAAAVGEVADSAATATAAAEEKVAVAFDQSASPEQRIESLEDAVMDARAATEEKVDEMALLVTAHAELESNYGAYMRTLPQHTLPRLPSTNTNAHTFLAPCTPTS